MALPIVIPSTQQQPQTTNVTYSDVETTFQQLFATVPAALDPAPPDVSLLAVADDLADMAADETQTESADLNVVPLAVKALAYNWDADELWVSGSGEPAVVTDDATAIEFCLLAANTPAGVYPVFTADFGNRVLDLEGLAMPTGAFASEVSRMTTEAFSGFPLITDVSVDAVQIVPEVDPDAVFITVTIATVFSQEDVIEFNMRMS